MSQAPTAQASPAAIMPIPSVDSPECHHATGDHRLRAAPIVKKTPAVKAIASPNACGSPTANGNSGAIPQSTKALKVLRAARQGLRTCRGRPYSSAYMVRTQRSRSSVIAATTRSKSAPVRPFSRKICRTSSRSPSGTVSTWRCSTASQ